MARTVLRSPAAGTFGIRAQAVRAALAFAARVAVTFPVVDPLPAVTRHIVKTVATDGPSADISGHPRAAAFSA